MTGQDVKCSKCDDTGKVPCPHPSAGGATTIYGWNPCECAAGDQYRPDPDKIYAGELRERGLPIPENIPDCAWIPLGSLVPDVESVEVEKGEGDTMSLGFQLKFLEPFRWVEATVALLREHA